MKRFMIATVLASAAVIPAHAADAGISLSIGQPGYCRDPRPRSQAPSRIKLPAYPVAGIAKAGSKAKNGDVNVHTER